MASSRLAILGFQAWLQLQSSLDNNLPPPHTTPSCPTWTIILSRIPGNTGEEVKAVQGLAPDGALALQSLCPTGQCWSPSTAAGSPSLNSAHTGPPTTSKKTRTPRFLTEKRHRPALQNPTHFSFSAPIGTTLLGPRKAGADKGKS